MGSIHTQCKAVQIACAAHFNQLDMGGCPYIFHPLHVASCMKTNNEKVVALLHDVMEDSNITKEYLSQFFDDNIVNAVELLTKKPGEDYETYIRNLAPNELARKVKIADLAHNMDITRLNELTPHVLENLKKYHKAWRFLTNYEGK